MMRALGDSRHPRRRRGFRPASASGPTALNEPDLVTRTRRAATPASSCSAWSTRATTAPWRDLRAGQTAQEDRRFTDSRIDHRRLRGAFGHRCQGAAFGGAGRPVEHAAAAGDASAARGHTADASRQVADGVTLLVTETKKMGGGLGDASAFLLAMQRGDDAVDVGLLRPPQFWPPTTSKKVALFFSLTAIPCGT